MEEEEEEEECESWSLLTADAQDMNPVDSRDETAALWTGSASSSGSSAAPSGSAFLHKSLHLIHVNQPAKMLPAVNWSDSLRWFLNQADGSTFTPASLDLTGCSAAVLIRRKAEIWIIKHKISA